MIVMFATAEKTFLLFLVDAVPNQTKLLLKHLTGRQKKAIREVAVNLLRGSLKVTEAQLQSLRKHKQFYRQLARGDKIRLLQKPIVLLLEAARPVLERL